jgi:hypothetical protein
MLRENLCDSVVSAPARRTSSHIHADDSEDGSIIELLTTTPNSCSQAEIIGKALYLDDRIVSLGPDAYASFEEITPDAARRVVVTSDNGALRYAASKHGKAAAYDDDMRAWMRGFVPVVLREAGVEVEARVARDREKGGVAEVLADIAQIKSTSAKRMHYEALLHGAPLARGEYDRVARQAGRELASAPTDLDAVLTLMSAGPTSGLRALERAVGKLAAAQQTMQDALGTALGQSKTGADTIKTLKEYADTDDPSIILMALKGASDMSSDSDKRTLLQMLAPRALGKRNSELRIAFFNVLGDFSSDSDVRVVLQDALTYAPRDSEITISVLRAVQNLSSDSDKRVVMTTAAHAGLINNTAARNAYMSAAKSLSSSTDYTVVIQALLKQ